MNPETEIEGGDDEIDVDLSGETGGSYVFADGDYPLRCVDVTRDISKASGKPMLVWSFLGGPELRNNTFKVFTSFSPEALWKMAEVVESMGLGKAGTKITFKKKDAIGKMVTGTLEKSEYDGKKRSQVAKVKPFEGSPQLEKPPF